MCVGSEDNGLDCRFLYLIYRLYREVRNEDYRWCSHKFSKQQKLCQKLGDKQMAEIYDMAAPRKAADQLLNPFVAATGLRLDDLPELFTTAQWKSNYVGQKWADIAHHAIKLRLALTGNDSNEAKRLTGMITSLEHNTATLGQKRGWRPLGKCCLKFGS